MLYDCVFPCFEFLDHNDFFYSSLSKRIYFRTKVFITQTCYAHKRLVCIAICTRSKIKCTYICYSPEHLNIKIKPCVSTKVSIKTT